MSCSVLYCQGTAALAEWGPCTCLVEPHSVTGFPRTRGPRESQVEVTVPLVTCPQKSHCHLLRILFILISPIQCLRRPHGADIRTWGSLGTLW